MMRPALRLALWIVGLAAAAVLFALTFTVAAVIALGALAALALFGRGPRIVWQVHRAETVDLEPNARGPGGGRPLIIDHDPNDLPPDRRLG